jgi:hypothetical protein
MLVAIDLVLGRRVHQDRIQLIRRGAGHEHDARAVG